MVQLDEVREHLDELLEISKFEDSSLNGLQVQGKEEVKKIGFAVDACLETFEKAVKEECQLLVVHHGLFWDSGSSHSEMRLLGAHLKRIKTLLSNELGLYVAHLPLDAHPRYGNNAELARILGVKKLQPFGESKGQKIGFSGQFKRKFSLNELGKLLKTTIGAEPKIFPFGHGEDEKLSTIAIVSGFGSSRVSEAAEVGADLFLTGEFAHSHYHAAKEREVSVIAAGHYATETLGLRALRPMFEKRFKVETVFLDAPTGL